MTCSALLIPVAIFMQAPPAAPPRPPSGAPTPVTPTQGPGVARAPAGGEVTPGAAGPNLPLTPDLPASPGYLLPSPDVSSQRVVTLEEAERLAAQNQPQIHQARAATAAAAGRVWEARSGYLPQIFGNALYERTTLNGTSSRSGGTGTTGTGTGGTGTGGTGTGGTGTGGTGTGGTGTGGTGTGGAGTGGAATVPIPTSNPWAFYNLFSAGLTASQLIYDFGQTSERWRAANRAEESLKETETATLHTVLLNVRSAFFAARANKALVKVAEETLSNELRHLAQVAGNVGVGISPEIDLATEKTTVANDRLSLIQAQNNYDIARVQLNVAMGVSTNTTYDVAEEGIPAVDGEDESIDALAKEAFANRPELRSLEKQREYNQLTVRSLKGGYGPTLSAIGGLSLADLIGNGIDTGAVPSAYVGAQLTWPLFEGLLTTGQVKEAEGNLGVADAQLSQERLQVRLDVEQARLAVRTYKTAIATADEALTNARYQLKLAEKRYSAGVGNIIELGDAQVAVTGASAQRVQADYNLATARAQLKNALGRP